MPAGMKIILTQQDYPQAFIFLEWKLEILLAQRK
jgi:hypothetical protein